LISCGKQVTRYVFDNSSLNATIEGNDLLLHKGMPQMNFTLTVVSYFDDYP